MLPAGSLATGAMQAPPESVLAPGPRPAGCALPPRPPALTRCWRCTSHTCGAWVGWPGPWKWAGRTGGSASWAGRRVCHLWGVGDEGGEDRQTHQSSPTAVPSGCIFDAHSTSSNTAPKSPCQRCTYTRTPKVSPGTRGGHGGRKRSPQILGGGWSRAGSTFKAELAQAKAA